MIHLAKKYLDLVGIFGGAYLLMSFVHWEMHPGKWQQSYRLLALIVTGGFAMLWLQIFKRK